MTNPMVILMEKESIQSSCHLLIREYEYGTFMIYNLSLSICTRCPQTILIVGWWCYDPYQKLGGHYALYLLYLVDT